MGKQAMRKYIVLWVIILALLPAIPGLGCQSEEITRSDIDALAEAEVLPTPVQTSDLTSVTDSINAISATTRTDFPKSLTFNLEVESNHEITDIELRYKINKIASIVPTVAVNPDFTPGTEVKTSWTWDTRKSSLPPGAQVEYRWIAQNAIGEEIETDPLMLTFADLRYEWQELAKGNVQLFWYQGDQSFGQELMDAAQAAQVKLARDTGASIEENVKIFIYANTEELQEALIFSQDWTGGMAFSEYGIVAIGVSQSRLDWGKRTVAHELTHLVMHQVTYNPYSDMPTWLDEGLAMYAEGELRPELKSRLNAAISLDTLFSVQSLSSSFPAETEEAAIAYAQSYSLVEFLIEDRGGRENMQELLQVFKRGSETDDALLEVYGLDADRLETEWRASL
ncbi:MAG: peptidase MA family metallohydrolase [Chloroflexota bacterium]|nr:peptidase MA family metallohydrolase [Chloroflexota bacterium]